MDIRVQESPFAFGAEAEAFAELPTPNLTDTRISAGGEPSPPFYAPAHGKAPATHGRAAFGRFSNRGGGRGGGTGGSGAFGRATNPGAVAGARRGTPSVVAAGWGWDDRAPGW